MDKKIEVKTDAEIKKESEKLLLIAMLKTLHKKNFINNDILTKAIADVQKL